MMLFRSFKRKRLRRKRKRNKELELCQQKNRRKSMRSRRRGN